MIKTNDYLKKRRYCLIATLGILIIAEILLYFHYFSTEFIGGEFFYSSLAYRSVVILILYFIVVPKLYNIHVALKSPKDSKRYLINENDERKMLINYRTSNLSYIIFQIALALTAYISGFFGDTLSIVLALLFILSVILQHYVRKYFEKQF